MARHYSIKRHESVAYKLNYEEQLDSEQFKVVTAENKPTLVIAGAGSGKTRAVTYRVARLIENGVSPERIMLVTFTNKAAREMLQRVDQLISADTRKIWGGTFHSIANRILRRNADCLGYDGKFTIIDSEDSKDILELVIEHSKIDLNARRFPQPGLLQELFTLAINKDIELAHMIQVQYPSLLANLGDIERVFQNFVLRKRACNVMDYDDLLLNWKRLLLENEEVRNSWCQHFEHILVDEYQDTNKIQADIVDILASQRRNVMVVGDDAQSIYGFRGAHFANILRFQERYPDAAVLHLDNNYRCRPEILDVANASISFNEKQFKKNLKAVRSAVGEKPALVPLSSTDQQAAFVACRILEINAQGVPLSDMAILYRSHFHSLEMQLELTRRGIPYSVRSGVRFFEQAHIKDIVAHLRIIDNPKDETAWKRVLKLVPGVGKNTALKIWERLSAHSNPLNACAEQGLAVKLKNQSGWTAFCQMIAQLNDPQMQGKPAAQIDIVLRGYYHDYLLNAFQNAAARVEDVLQLGNYALRFSSVGEFLSELFLVGGEKFGGAEGAAGEDIIDGGDDDDDRIVLSSMHQAKGLEWRYVFLIWTAEGKFPSARSLKDTDSLEEERRLFYVAVTRAKDELNVCYPLVESDFTRLMVVQRPSRFISELPQDLFEPWTVD